MTFRQRLPYYLVGLFIGVVIVNFVLTKKSSSFDYWPNARVLKNISKKQLIFSEEVSTLFKNKEIDSLQVLQVLKDGDVDMWNKIKIDSCFQYNIEGRNKLKNITVTIKNCDSIATIKKVVVK
ncbi:MAG: hypothetical protein R3342_01240 [Lutibacter sp.]|uniref:hypothetical protein n=1 Tax=Lutibacter sp. TaxID=1925666 RepID=UPI00299ED617|nr:hypothetical protein [Lutibacter sp.]MDX1828144.1 hypothetical protein [Lutibacter sp.]